MIEIRGKYNEAKIFTDVVDSASLAQVQELCNQEFTAGSRIRLMPDIHAGKGCTIGTTMTITDKVVPNLVGVDIGCGMETVRVRETRLELQKLDKLIREKIPSGFSAKLLSELQNRILQYYFAILPLRRVIERERTP
jgi:tRNA-splicing ligase RtcB